MKKRSFIIFIVFILLINMLIVSAYKYEGDSPVHQHITKESEKVWVNIPDEVKSHLDGSIYTSFTRFVTDEYNVGDDIIDGAAEEDSRTRSFGHFWQPDVPRNGTYDDGLNTRLSAFTPHGEHEASYRRARDYWLKYVIPLYVEGNIDASYYWLGRVAHLTQDASQPSHVLMDCHPNRESIASQCDAANGGNIEDDDGADDSVLEKYIINLGTFTDYAHPFVGAPYRYKNLIGGKLDEDTVFI